MFPVRPTVRCTDALQEQHASFLENNLLGQLRAAQKGQELNVWVKGKTKLRIRVGQYPSCLPSVRLTNADETNPATTGTSAVLVNPDTEVFVAPRPRNVPSRPQPPPATVIQPEAPKASVSSAHSDASPTNKRTRVRLVPQEIAGTWGDLREEDFADDLSSGHRLVLCSERTLRRIRRKLNLPEKGAALVRIDTARPDDVKTPSEPLGQSDAEKDGDPGVGEEPFEARLAAWGRMPDGCFVIPGQTDERWKGWQTLR